MDFWGSAAPPEGGAASVTYWLDLANQVDGRCKGFAAFFPLGGANLTGMFAHIDGCLDLADQFHGITANDFAGDFGNLDNAVRIDNKGRTVGKALAFTQDAEIVADHMILVAQHVIVDLANGGRAVVPCLVAEMCVGRHGINFNAHGLQVGILVGQIFKFGGAYEGKVGGIEKEYCPLALYVRVGNFNELACLIRLRSKRLNGRTYDTNILSFRV